MKRSSSKLIAKAGSVRNINKAGFKFNFTLHIESVDKMMGSNDVVVTWERRPKVLSTKPARVDRNSRTAHFGGETLSQEVTLFKKKKEGAEFEPKVYKLTVRNNSERGKLIGKIEIDFADYVQMPSASKRIGASLSNGGRIILRVESSFLGEAKVRRDSRGSGSVGSSTFADDAMSAGGDPLDRDHLDDFEDMSVDDDHLSATSHPPPVSTPQPPLRKTSSVTTRRPPTNPPGDEPTTGGKFRRKGSAPLSPTKRATEDAAMVAAPRNASRMKSDSEVGATNTAVISRPEFEKLKRENRALRRKNDDLTHSNADLERRLEHAMRLDDGADSVEQLMEDNTELRREVDDLEARLKREPVYSDVVRELREAKMALAILTLDKEKLLQEVRRLRK